MKWIVDMEAFQVRGKWYPKEIAILNPLTLKCVCLMIKCGMPYRYLEPFDLPIVRCQFAMHGIYWDSGDFSLSHAKEIITSLVDMEVDDVYVKGDQKESFFRNWFPRVHQVVAPPFRYLNKCNNRVCDKNHNRNCAQRKCFELVPYVL
jgi:hypothetical protein